MNPSTINPQPSTTQTAAPTCIATTSAGHVCGRPASVLDESRGGLVCGVHAPKFGAHYEVTRAVLAKVEELLTQAAKHAHHETKKGRDESAVTVPILDLAVRTRRLRVLLSGSALLLFLFLSGAAVQAQSTYVNYPLNFVGGVATLNLTVGTNILARALTGQGRNITNGTATVTYPGLPPMTFTPEDDSGDDDAPILGPCTIQLTYQGSAGAVGVLLVQYEVVNATPPAQTVVQPAGTAITMSLQSSTDLVTWTPAQNGVYPASAGNRFFRMSLTR